MSQFSRRSPRAGLVPIVLALALAACQGVPPTAIGADEAGFSAQRGASKGKLQVGGKEIVLRTRDGGAIGDLAIQIGGKAYPLKGGKLALPADVLAKAKADGSVLVIAPGYVPRRVKLDQADEAVLVPIEGASPASAIGPLGGRAGSGGDVAVVFPAGRLPAGTDVVVATYDPPPAPNAAVTAEQQRLAQALRQDGVAPPACGEPLPCPPATAALGIYVAIDGPLTAGPLPVEADLVAMRRGWDGQGPKPWEGAAAGWTETEKRQAAAADRLLATFAAIDARPDAAAWRRAIAAEFGLVLEGRRLTVTVPIGEAARTDGTARIEVVGAALLGALIEVTVVSAATGELPPAARPSTMPPPTSGASGGAGGTSGPGGAGGTGGAGGAGGGVPAAFAAIRGDKTMGADGGGVLLSFGIFRGDAASTLIGMDGGSLIGMDGATLIGNDGATLVPRDGVPLIGNDGGRLISDDGSTLIGADGGSLISDDGSTLIGADGGSLISDDGSTLIGNDGGTLVADNVGGSLTGQLRVPFQPEGAKYRLQGYADYPWPEGRVWAMNALGQPYAAAVTTREDASFTVDGMKHTLSGVVLAAAAGPYRLFALAKAPGAATRQVPIDAATTAASCVQLAGMLKSPGAIRPVDLDRYQALVTALRAGMSDQDAKFVVSNPIQAVAKHVVAFCTAQGIPLALGPTASTFAGTPVDASMAGPFVGGDMSNGRGRLSFPTDIEVVGGDLLVADNNNRQIQRIRLADAFGSTVETLPEQPRELAVKASGEIFVTTGNTARLYQANGPVPISGAGASAGMTTGPVLLAGTFSNLETPGPFIEGPALAARLGQTMGLAVAPDGALWIADRYEQRILKYDAGMITTVAGGTDILVDFLDGPAASARFTQPYGVLFAPNGDLWISDNGARRVRKLTTAGQVVTVAGSGLIGSRDGFGKAATFDRPLGMALDAKGNLYLADGELNGGRIRKITPQGLVLTIAGGRPQRPFEVLPHADGPGPEALFHDPHALTFGPDGALYVADTRNHCIRKITF